MNKIVWPAAAAAVLSAISILSFQWEPSFSLATGLAAITNAILATRVD